MLRKRADSWDVKDLHNIVLIDSGANHTYKRIGIEATRAFIKRRQVSPEEYNRSQKSASHTESTEDWSLIINNISDNLSTELVVT